MISRSRMTLFELMICNVDAQRGTYVKIFSCLYVSLSPDPLDERKIASAIFQHLPL